MESQAKRGSIRNWEMKRGQGPGKACDTKSGEEANRVQGINRERGKAVGDMQDAKRERSFDEPGRNCASTENGKGVRCEDEDRRG